MIKKTITIFLALYYVAIFNQFQQIQFEMSSIPVKFGNKIVQQKEQQKNLQFHYASLRRVRPITGKIAQYHDNITINNNKKQMNIQNRFTQIQRENRMLLEKITSIMTKGSTIHTINRNQGSQGKLNKSLNSSFRRKQMQSIELQNAKMLKRLKQKRSSYQVEKLNKDWRKRKQVIKNMTSYPFILNDNLGVSRNAKGYSQYQFKRFNQNLWKENQIVKLRKIDGVSFLVTVKIQGGKLFIIADCKEDRQIKVIQLPKSDAEDFLYNQCKSNIENVFNLLRYDRTAGVLYLVGNDVQGVEQIRQLQDQKRNIRTADDTQKRRIPMINNQIRPISKQSIRKKKYQNIEALNEQDEGLQFSAKKNEPFEQQTTFDLAPPKIQSNWVKIQKKQQPEQKQEQEQQKNENQEQDQIQKHNRSSNYDQIQPPKIKEQSAGQKPQKEQKVVANLSVQLDQEGQENISQNKSGLQEEIEQKQEQIQK